MRMYVLILMFCFCLQNCNDKHKKDLKINKITDIKFDINKNKKQLEQVILQNDTLSYNRLFKEYVVNGYDKEFLYYAILMAERNNYRVAYQDVSAILYSNSDDTLSYESIYATYTMLKAYEMGDKVAKESVKNIYSNIKKKIPKSSSIYCK